MFVKGFRRIQRHLRDAGYFASSFTSGANGSPAGANLMWRRVPVLVTTVLTVSLITVILVYWSGRGRPPVRFLATEFDFGNVRSGGSFTCQFQFTNESDRPVTIAEVHGTCGCVGKDFPRGPVPAGESGSIRVTLSTKGIQPPRRLAKRLVVLFHPSGIRPADLRVRATVSPELTCDPPVLVFKPGDRGSRLSGEITIRREILPVDDFAALQLEAPAEYYEVRELARGKHVYRAHISFTREEPVWRPPPLRVRYRHNGKQASHVVPVTFEMRKDAELLPSAYVQAIPAGISGVELAESTKAHFVLRPLGRGPIRISEILPDRPEDRRLFQWRIHQGGRTFEMWLCACPPVRNAVYSTGFLVTAARPGGVKDRVRLDAHVLVTAEQ